MIFQVEISLVQEKKLIRELFGELHEVVTVSDYKHTCFRWVFLRRVLDLGSHNIVWVEYEDFAPHPFLEIIVRHQKHHICLALSGRCSEHSELLILVDSHCSHVALEEVVFVLCISTSCHSLTASDNSIVDDSEFGYILYQRIKLYRHLISLNLNRGPAGEL